jgi:hypothetical protein
MWRQLDREASVSRRVYYVERVGLGRGPITAYFDMHEFRPGENWRTERDRLERVVQKQLLKEAPFAPIGQISLYDVWASIIPSVRPSHWITAGYRSTQDPKIKEPIIHFPASLGDTDKAIEDIGGPCFFAIDALPYPESIEAIDRRDRAVFCLTLLYAMSIAVREQMRAGGKTLMRLM